MLNAKQVQHKEPELATSVIAAVEVPGESLIDPWSAPHAYLLQALENGASLIRHCRLENGHFDGRQWQLETSRGKN